MGALAETSTGYVTVFSRDDEDSGFVTRKIYLGFTSKDSMNSSWKMVSSRVSRSVPQLAPTGLDGGYILWNETDYFFTSYDDLYYAAYSADGSVGAVQTAKGYLSDCAPIQYNGKTVWYTTNNSAPVFYTLDASGVTATPAGGSAAPGTPSQPAAPAQPSGFTDLSTSHWAYNDIKTCVDMGIAGGNPDGSFKPEDHVTNTQFLARMVRIFYKDELAAVTTPAGEPWYYATNKVAEDTKLSWGLLVEDLPIYRFNMATVIDNYLNHSGAARKISDQKILENCALLHARDGKQPVNEAISDWTFVARCMAAGIITGKDDGLFHGEQYMTRAEACVVINRLVNFVNG